MATVKKIARVETEVEEITLALTKTEARVLVALTGHVCGEGYFFSANERVYNALYKAGYEDGPSFNVHTRWFRDDEDNK